MHIDETSPYRRNRCAQHALPQMNQLPEVAASKNGSFAPDKEGSETLVDAILPLAPEELTKIKIRQETQPPILKVKR